MFRIKEAHQLLPRRVSKVGCPRGHLAFIGRKGNKSDLSGKTVQTKSPLNYTEPSCLFSFKVFRKGEKESEEKLNLDNSFAKLLNNVQSVVLRALSVCCLS